MLLAGACETPIVDASVDATSTEDAGGPAVMDSGSSDPAENLDTATAEETATAPEQGFVLGVNVTGQNQPGSFSELPEGGDLVVELGAQGLWMVVLAFKTYGHFEGKVMIRATIAVDDENQGELALAKQKLAPGGDGWEYYYNFFLVVPDPALAGLPALVTMRIQDDEDEENEIVVERNVMLIGGEP